MWEQQHVANRRGIGQYHHQAVDAYALARRRRHAVFQRRDIVLVIGHRFLIARGLGRDLRSKALGLIVRVVQLGEAIGNLAASDEELETVGHERVIVVAARKRRDFGRVVGDEQGPVELGLGGLLEDLNQHLAAPVARFHGHMETRCDRACALVGREFGSADVGVVGEDGLNDGHAREGATEVVTLALILDHAVAEHGQSQFAQHGFGQIDEVPIIRIGRIELKHGELGVVARRQTLVAEVAIDLEHPLDTAHYQTLQIQLRCDTQIQIHVEAVVMRNKGSRRRATRHHLHHRCLDFEITALVQKAPDELDHCGANAEHAARVIVHDEVEIALTIARFEIRQAMPLVRQRPQSLGQEAQLVDHDRQLALLGAEHHALGANDVTQVPFLEFVVDTLGQAVAFDEQLYRTAHILEVGKRGLALHALRHHAAGDRDAQWLRFEIGRAGLGEARMQIAGQRIATEVIAIGVAAGADVLKFGAALRDECRFSAGYFVIGHLESYSPIFRLASMNMSRPPSNTACGLPVSTSVRRSLMRDWSST